MSATKLLRTIAIVALIRFCAAFIDDQFLYTFDFNKYISYFYFPAGINVMSMLIFGYQAAFGLALGSFSFLMMTNSNGALINGTFGLITPITALIAYFMIAYAKFGRIKLEPWSDYRLGEVFSFFMIYSLLNAIAHILGMAYIIHFSTITLQSITAKFIGNLMGCLTLFIGMSLIMWIFLLLHHQKTKQKI